MTNGSGKDEIIARIQQREKEQSLLLSLSDSLAPVITRKEFHDVVNNLLKNTIGFNHFTVCIEDEPQKGYRLQYHNTPADYTKHKTAIFTDRSGIFYFSAKLSRTSCYAKKRVCKSIGVSFFSKGCFATIHF